MRRVLVICAVAVTIFAAIAALRLGRARTVHAASQRTADSQSIVGQARVAAPDASLGFSFLYSGDPTIALPGCALGPALTFCSQVPGSTSQSVPFTITFESNANGVSVSTAAIPGLTSIFAPGDFTISADTCSGNFIANDTCTFNVAFSPTTTGLRQAALTINGFSFLNLAGTGVNFAVTAPAAPACGGAGLPPGNAFTYCQEAVGAASGSQAFTIAAANAITGLNVAFTAVPGLSSEFNSADFTIEGTNCTGALSAGGSCNVDVAFTPKEAGLRAALLTATDSNGDVATFSLAGQTTTGIAFPKPVTSTCRLRFFDFCNEPSGGNSAPITYTVQNTSGTQITGLTITPPIPTNPPTQNPTDFTVQGTTCTSTLAANATCTISVIFTPQGTGVRQGSIGVTDAQGDSAGFNLAGYGDDYQVQLASGQQSELTVAQGSSITYNAQVMPDNVFGANGEQVTLVCPTNLPAFSTCAFNNCPLTITPGTATSFTITIDTSSKTSQAPPVTSPCSETNGAAPPSSGPQMMIQFAPEPVAPKWLFPALALLAAAMAIGGATFSRRRARAGSIFAAAGVAAIIFAACGGGGNKNIGVTPIAVTPMTINGNALDANGDALNAGRPLAITLDVVKGR